MAIDSNISVNTDSIPGIGRPGIEYALKWCCEWTLHVCDNNIDKPKILDNIETFCLVWLTWLIYIDGFIRVLNFIVNFAQ